MAKPQIFTIVPGQDVVIGSFSVGSSVLRFEGPGLSAAYLVVEQQGQDTILSFVGSATRVRLTNFESSGFGAQNVFSQALQFPSATTAATLEGLSSAGLNTATASAGGARPAAGPEYAATTDAPSQPATVGGSGRDWLAGTEGSDTLRGNAGNDTLDGAGGDDRVDGGFGVDLVRGGGGDDTLVGSVDSMWTRGWRASNKGSPDDPGAGETVSISGMTRSHDMFDGGEGTDVLRLGSGNDAIFLEDSFSPAAGDGPRVRSVERIEAGDGNDIVDLTSAVFAYGAVEIDGGAGNDTLWSSAGDDRLSGGAGNDSLSGGAGGDLLMGGAGIDRIDGGAGIDTAAYSSYISDYVFSRNAAGALVVTGVRAGAADGADTLVNVEYLRFLDGVVVPTADLGFGSVPDARDGVGTGEEDRAIAGRLVATDADGDALSFALDRGPANGTVTIGPDGTYIYVPRADFNGQDSFTFTVSDGKGGSDTATIRLDVAPVNDAPSTTDGAASGAEDTAVHGRVSASDVDGDALSFALARGPANGTVTVNPDGTYTYTPNANFNGTDSFAYTAADGKGGTVTGTVSVDVAAVNDAPTTSSVSIAGREDGTIAGRVSGADVDGDAVRFALGEGPTNGRVTMNADGTFRYVPSANFNGTDSFTYTVSDGKGGTVTGTVSVNVAAVNDAPTTTGGAASGTEDTAVHGRVTASDVDGDALSFALARGPANGTVTVNPDGTYTYTPRANFNGADSFTYTAADGKGGTVTGTVSVSVAAVNDAPTTGGGTASGTEDTAVHGRVSASDVDGDALSFALARGPANGTVTVNPDGTYTYTPRANFNGADSFTYTAADGKGGTVTGTVSVNVAAANDAPVTSPASVETREDTAISGQLAATDPDGDAITYYLPSAFDGASGRLTFNPDGSFTFQPKADWNGQVEVAYIARDAQGAETPGRLYINVTPVNDAPVALTTAASATEDMVLAGRLAAIDADGNAMTFGLAPGGGPRHGTLTIQPDGSYTYVPAANFSGTDTFSYTVSDGAGGVSTATVAVAVAPVNDAPVAPPPVPLAGIEDTVVSGRVIAADADGDALSYTLVAPPGRGSLTFASDGSYTYTPSANFNGTDSFTVRVADGAGGSVEVTQSIQIAAVNDAPTAVAASAAGLRDQPISGTLVASDVDGDSLFFAIAANGGPAHGTLVVQSDGRYVYTPDTGYRGADSFVFAVADGKGGTATATVSLVVVEPNVAPTATRTAFTTAEDTALAGNLRVTDPEGQAFTVALAQGPAHGTVTVRADGTFTYLGAANYNGVDGFSVTLTDALGASRTQTVSLNVTPVVDVPYLAPVRVAIDEDSGPVTIPLNAVNPDGYQVGFGTGVWQSPIGNYSMGADGKSVVFTPAADASGTANLSVVLTDSLGNRTSVPLTIEVRPVDDGPRTTLTRFFGDEDTVTTGRLSAFDPEGGTIASYVLASGPSGGTMTINRDGTFAYTPPQDWYGTESFTYVATDSTGASSTLSGTLTIRNVLDAPTISSATFTGAQNTLITGRVAVANPDDPVGRGYEVRIASGYSEYLAHGVISFSPDGTFTYRPHTNWSGTDKVEVTVVNSSGLFSTQTATVTLVVTPVNSAPYMKSEGGAYPHFSLSEDTPYRGNLGRSPGTTQTIVADLESSVAELTFAVARQAQHGTVTVAANGDFVYTPAANFSGWDTFAYTVTDPDGGVVTVEAGSIYVHAVVDPIVWTTSFEAVGNRTLRGDVADSEAALTAVLEDNPSHGRLSLSADGTFVYTPKDGFSGVDSFRVTVYGEGGGETRRIYITVDGNDAPVAQHADIAGTASAPITGKLMATDADGDSLSFKLLASPADGTLTLNAEGSFVYRPTGVPGAKTFEYEVSDGRGGVTKATQTIDVYGEADHRATGPLGDWTLSDHVRDTVHVTPRGVEGPDKVTGFQVDEDKLDLSALLQNGPSGVPADWAAQLVAHYDTAAGGTWVGVSAAGGATDWGVLLVGVNTTLDDLLGHNALTAGQQSSM